MKFNTKLILEKVPEYGSFLTLEEMNSRVSDVARKYGFQFSEIGKSFENRPLYLLTVGNGERNAFLWGFPHPNEPIGSLTIDFILNYLGENLDVCNINFNP